MFFKNKADESLFVKLRISYAEQLKRKEEEISRLKQENQLLMKTALKQSDNTAKWMEYAKKVEGKLNKNKKDEPKP